MTGLGDADIENVTSQMTCYAEVEILQELQVTLLRWA
jgi:hypothetical protein